MDARIRGNVLSKIEQKDWVGAIRQASQSDAGLYWPDERSESIDNNIKECLAMIENMAVK